MQFNSDLSDLPDWTQIGSTGVYYRKYNHIVEIDISKIANVSNIGTDLATLPRELWPATNVLHNADITINPSYPEVQILIVAATGVVRAQAWSSINGVNIRAHFMYLA